MTLRDDVIASLRGAGVDVIAVGMIRPSGDAVAVVRPAGISPDGYASVEVILSAPPAGSHPDPDEVLDRITTRAWRALAGQYQDVSASGPISVGEPELQGYRQPSRVMSPPAPAMAIVVTSTCRLSPI